MEDRDKLEARSDNKAKAKERNEHLAHTHIPGPRSCFGNWLLNFGANLTRRRANWQISGREHIPQDRPYVIVANHVTFIDALWILKSLPPDHCDRTCALIGADLKTDYGLIGKLMTIAARSIPVDRKGKGAARSLIIAKNAMAEGNNILIHPEGTRSRNGQLGPFESGAAYLGYKYKAPILPVYIKGGHDIWPPSQKLPRFRDKKGQPKNLTLYFAPCIEGGDFDDAKELNRALEQKYRDWQAELGY